MRVELQQTARKPQRDPKLILYRNDKTFNSQDIAIVFNDWGPQKIGTKYKIKKTYVFKFHEVWLAK